MGMYTLKNKDLAVQVISLGAELKSLKNCRTRQEYMWGANPEYWKRTSPILFPLVGNYKNKEVRYNGRMYSLPQHGFARDMRFETISLAKDEIWMGLSSDVETLQKYPCPFRLEIGYKLEENKVRVSWRVINTGQDTMYFSIGGHPGFICPVKEGERQTDYFLRFDTDREVISRLLGTDGLATDTLLTYPLEDGYLQIADNLFEHDALIIENHQAQKVSLCTPDRKPYVTVTFDAPLFGVWSVPGKAAPFVCIEPWYGRCDRTDFKGTLQEREWGNVLEAGKIFEAHYTIEVE